MELPWKFPDPMDEARKRAAKFQRLSPDERWRTIVDVIEWGMVMIRLSPHREANERVTAERERARPRMQKEFFAHHGS